MTTNRIGQLAEHITLPLQDDPLYDLTAPKFPVEILLDADGKLLWINMGGSCVLRICQNVHGFVIKDDRRRGEPR